MAGPNDSDDGWGELLHELGIEQPQPPPPPVEPEPVPLTLFEAEADDDLPAESPPADEFEPADRLDADEEMESDADTDSETAEDGEPGEPKKKRRRRRRRKKKGAGEETTAEAGEVAVGEAAEPLDDGPFGGYDESSPVEPVGEELPSAEASRELIANWDVPSWETIIHTMLYRPGGK